MVFKLQDESSLFQCVWFEKLAVPFVNWVEGVEYMVANNA